MIDDDAVPGVDDLSDADFVHRELDNAGRAMKAEAFLAGMAAHMTVMEEGVIHIDGRYYIGGVMALGGMDAERMQFCLDWLLHFTDSEYDAELQLVSLKP